MATVVRTVEGAQNIALWRTAQVCGLSLTLVLLAALWLEPQPALRVLWYAVIPVLPAVFLLHPGIWRNVCPLATLNTLPGRFSRGWKLSAAQANVALVAGFVLLALLVPARRFLFNTDGHALAVVIGAVALLALGFGFLFDRKAGFCNSICPVLPVEKLYGQDPMTSVENVHCSTCSLCTARACLDLAPSKSASFGLRRRGHLWFLTPYGAFAASFPGFVLAYYRTPDTTLAHAGSVYLEIALGCALSFGVVSLSALLLRATAERVLPWLGAATLVIYYWFGASSIAQQWQAGTALVHTIRFASVLLASFWLARHFGTRMIAARRPARR